MKKMVAMGLAVCMGVMSLSGCAGGSKNAAAGGEQTAAEQTVTGDEPFESTEEQPESETDHLEPSETSLVSEPSGKRRGRRSKKN